jgi:SAM-dependent methyltransferase
MGDTTVSESKICQFCQGKLTTWLENCPDYYLKFSVAVTYYRCEDCQSTVQDPIPEDISRFYESYPIHKKKSIVHRVMSKFLQSQMYCNVSALNRDIVLLDFGCGDGGFLEQAKQYCIEAYGFEVNPDHAAALEQSLEIKIFHDSEYMLNQLEGKVDIVTMHMVLEHLAEVPKLFHDVERLLKPGGVFYFVIPNALSWEARLFRKHWHGLDPPRHLTFPSTDAIQDLANRNNFQYDCCKPVSFPNSIAGSLASLFGHGFNYFLFILFLPFSIIVSALFPSGSYAYRLKKLKI